MTESDCRSLAPLVLLLFIPIMLIVDHHDEPVNTQPSPSVDYSKPVGDFITYLKSWGIIGLFGFGMIMFAISYKSWQSHHKQLAVFMLLLIPIYYVFFVSQVQLTSALPFPHLINQTMVNQKP